MESTGCQFTLLLIDVIIPVLCKLYINLLQSLTQVRCDYEQVEFIIIDDVLSSFNLEREIDRITKFPETSRTNIIVNLKKFWIKLRYNIKRIIREL